MPRYALLRKAPGSNEVVTQGVMCVVARLVGVSKGQSRRNCGIQDERSYLTLATNRLCKSGYREAILPKPSFMRFFQPGPRARVSRQASAIALLS